MSNNAPSYKSLIGQLEAFANGHFIIKQFSFGEITDFDLQKDSKYPIMHVLHPTVSVAPGVINYDLTVIFSDLPRDFEDKTTYQMEQISDLFRLGQDLLNVITNENNFQLFGKDADIDGTATMTSEAQETKNNLVQVTLEFTLQLPNDWSACDVPADWTIGQSGGGNVIPGPCCDVEYYISKNYQPGNDFVVGEVIRVSGNNTFAKAQANTEANAAAVGFVTVAGDSFNYKMGGIVTEGVPNQPAGTVMYLSATTAGALTATPPTIKRPIMVIVEPGQRAILDIHWMSAGGGGGAVDSVNGQTGVVVLDAADVGADPAGSAATAETNANNYTDTQLLGYVQGVTGNIVDNTDPQNPIVTQVQADWNQSDNTEPDFIKNKPTIPTGTVESVSGDSVDNTDPVNPVVNAIPLAGTSPGSPVTGPIEFGGDGYSLGIYDDILQLRYTDGINFLISVGANGVIYYLDLITGYGTSIAVGSSGIASVSSNDPSFESNQVPDSILPLAWLKKRFWTKAGAPTTSDDSTQGYVVGSLLWDTTNSILYRCTNNTTGAAVWTVAISGGGTPAGSDTQVQFNDGGAFGAEAAFTYNKTTNTLDVDKVTVDDEAYGSSWNGSLEVPTKNAVYDKIQTLPQQDSTFLSQGHGNTTTAAGGTNYGAVFGGANTLSTTESIRQSIVPTSGTLSRFYVRTNNAQPGTGTYVFTVRVNGVNTGITLTVAAGAAAGTFSDTTNSVAVNAGDLVSFSAVNNASGASAQLLTTSILLTR